MTAQERYEDYLRFHQKEALYWEDQRETYRVLFWSGFWLCLPVAGVVHFDIGNGIPAIIAFAVVGALGLDRLAISVISQESISHGEDMLTILRNHIQRSENNDS